MIPGVSISPSVFVSTLMRLGVITNTREISTRDEIIWTDAIDDIAPLTQEERSNIVHFDQKQMRANRAALTFYNQMLKDNRVLRELVHIVTYFKMLFTNGKGVQPMPATLQRMG
jgi:hypothetical protein